MPKSHGQNGKIEKDPKTGKFLPGNRGGPGSPYKKKIGQFRRAVIEAVTPEDVQEVIDKLMGEAKAGKPWAVREFLDRVVGKPDQKLSVDADVSGDDVREAVNRLMSVRGVREALQAAEDEGG